MGAGKMRRCCLMVLIWNKWMARYFSSKEVYSESAEKCNLTMVITYKPLPSKGRRSLLQGDHWGFKNMDAQCVFPGFLQKAPQLVLLGSWSWESLLHNLECTFNQLGSFKNNTDICDPSRSFDVVWVPLSYGASESSQDGPLCILDHRTGSSALLCQGPSLHQAQCQGVIILSGVHSI